MISPKVQKRATKLFIYASVAFGVFGIVLVVVTGPDGDNTPLNTFLLKCLQTTVFIILPSFAVSVAGKYLNGK